jgi:hypothetical protein
MTKLYFDPSDIYMSDEYDCQVEYLEVMFDPLIIDQADKILKGNPILQSVTVSLGVDFNVDEGYGGKAREARISISKWACCFKFTNEWTDTVYCVDLVKGQAEPLPVEET